MSLPRRVLALEIRASKFGFAVLEGPDRLLDWGVRSFGEEGEALESAVSDRTGTLLDFYDPIAVVLRGREHNSASRSERVSTIVGTIELVTKRRRATFRILSTMQ